MTPAQRAVAIQKLDTRIAKASAELDNAKAKAGPALTEQTRDKLGRLREALDELKNDRKEAVDDGPEKFKVTDLQTGIESIDKGIAKANANPKLWLYKFQSSAYKFFLGADSHLDAVRGAAVSVAPQVQAL